MSRQQLDRFRERAGRVQLPESVRDAVLSKATSVPGAAERRPRRHMPTRRTVVRAGLTAAGAAAAFLALGVVFRPNEHDPATGTKNYFTLVAYAEGVPYADGAVVAKQLVGESGSRGGSPEHGWYAARTLNFDVTGTGVGTIAYSIEGPYVGQPSTGDEGAIAEPCVYLDFIRSGAYYETGGGSLPAAAGSYDGFTVEYANQEAEREMLNRVIWTEFPSDDELNALSQERDDLLAASQTSPTYESTLASMRASNAFWSLVERRSAELVAQTELVLTVTFENGETQTKRYAITPRDDFDEIVAERDEKNAEYAALIELYGDDPAHEEEVEAARQALEELRASTPDLYVLTETVA